MSYTNLLYHVVYATKEPAPLITSDLKPRLHEYLGGIVNGMGCIPIEINGMSEHVHYIRDQEKHHDKMSFTEEFEAVLRTNGIEFDKQYLWT